MTARGELRWRRVDATLYLQGALECDSLDALWQQRQTLLTDITCVDISELSRVDSAGLALLLHVQNLRPETPIPLRGVSERLRTLITLYNLQDIVVCTAPSANLA
ncbi:MAG: lipid asymmetry maintenance protein MlaB [Edwardsiella sp. (in: enterobacteria)]